MTYTLTANENTIIRDEDGAFIPTDPDNMDYQKYLAWLDEGNEPTPYTPPPAEAEDNRMAETQTPNFKWTKPDIGGDATVWGNVLNQTIDAIDAVAWATLNSGVPIGTVAMFAGFTPPVNWMWCNGAVYLDTDVPSLVAILNHAWPGSDSTHTAVPNLWSGRTPVGYDGGGWTMGASGGE